MSFIGLHGPQQWDHGLTVEFEPVTAGCWRWRGLMNEFSFSFFLAGEMTRQQPIDTKLLPAAGKITLIRRTISKPIRTALITPTINKSRKRFFYIKLYTVISIIYRFIRIQLQYLFLKKCPSLLESKMKRKGNRNENGHSTPSQFQTRRIFILRYEMKRVVYVEWG